VRLPPRESCVFDRDEDKPSGKESSMKHLKNFLREDSGQDMVEYALLGAFISIVAIAALRAIGPLVTAVFTKIQNELSSTPT